jgi:hypothetical protein
VDKEMTDTEDPNPADFDFENRRSSSGPTTYSSGPLVYNPIALVSLVSGILSLTGMFMGGIFTSLLLPVAIVAIVTGGVGLHYANKGGGGKGMATSGLIFGIFYLVLMVLAFFLWAV